MSSITETFYSNILNEEMKRVFFMDQNTLITFQIQSSQSCFGNLFFLKPEMLEIGLPNEIPSLTAAFSAFSFPFFFFFFFLREFLNHIVICSFRKQAMQSSSLLGELVVVALKAVILTLNT